METSSQTHSSGYFWLTWWEDTGPKWLKVVIPQTSGVQVQVQCDHFSPESLCVAGKCWWIFGEIITVCAAQKCINIPEMSVFWTIGSPQVRILTVTNLMPPSHFHIWRDQEKQNSLKLSSHWSSHPQLFSDVDSPAHPVISQPMRGQYWGYRQMRSQQSSLAARGCEGQLPWEPSEFWVKQNILR